MIFDQETPSAESLVPPRPNLGPEPWQEPSRWPIAAVWWGSGIVLACLLAFLWRARRRKKGRKVFEIRPDGPSIDLESSPSQRLIASSELVRAALIGTFGVGWGSKTTEEIAADPALAGRFGPIDSDQLVGFLRLSDRVKFASREPDGLEEWEAWAALFASRLAAGVKANGQGA